MGRPGEFYRHSGKVSPSLPIWMIVIGGDGAVLGAFVYACALKWSFDANLSVMACGLYAGFAFLLAWGTVLWGRVRSPFFAGVAGGAVGAFALYAAWVAWLFVLSNQRFLVLEPKALYGSALFLSETGVWELEHKHTPKGWELLGIWGAEAAAVFFAAIAGGVMAIRGKAFDEATGEWATQAAEIEPLDIDPGALDLKEGDDLREVIAERLRVGDWKPLLTLRRLPAGSNPHLKLRLRHNPSETLFLASLWFVIRFQNKQGAVQKKEIPIVPDMIVDSETFERLGAEAGQAMVQLQADAAQASESTSQVEPAEPAEPTGA